MFVLQGGARTEAAGDGGKMKAEEIQTGFVYRPDRSKLEIPPKFGIVIFHVQEMSPDRARVIWRRIDSNPMASTGPNMDISTTAEFADLMLCAISVVTTDRLVEK